MVRATTTTLPATADTTPRGAAKLPSPDLEDIAYVAIEPRRASAGHLDPSRDPFRSREDRGISSKCSRRVLLESIHRTRPYTTPHNATFTDGGHAGSGRRAPRATRATSSTIGQYGGGSPMRHRSGGSTHGASRPLAPSTLGPPACRQVRVFHRPPAAVARERNGLSRAAMDRGEPLSRDRSPHLPARNWPSDGRSTMVAADCRAPLTKSLAGAYRSWHPQPRREGSARSPRRTRHLFLAQPLTEILS